MAPRKRASSSSSSSKKSNQQPSQPAKYGIQHFFERHSQSVAVAASQNAATPRVTTPPPTPANPIDNAPPPEDAAPVTIDPPVVEVSHLEVSPEFAKAVPLKRVKFSPGMLIKQSQDDGGDEVTWKISPINERLQSVAKKLPGVIKVLSDASKRSQLSLRSCSQKQNAPCSTGKASKPLAYPTKVNTERSFINGGLSSLKADARKVISASRHMGDLNMRTVASQQTPFLTPPSISYRAGESNVGISCNGASDHSGSQRHKKALLELLDQMEDVITVEDPISLKAQEKGGDKEQTKAVPEEQASPDNSSETTDCSFSNLTFLVLEVSEKQKISEPSSAQSPYKVLRLLNEHNGKERVLLLYDEWFHSLVGPGDTIHVIGEFDDQGKCVVDSVNNLVIIHPDILLSGTRVSSSFTCLRRAVLDERLKSTEYSNAALIGTLLHQIFQTALCEQFPTREFLEKQSRIVLQKNIESLYASGVNEEEIYVTLIEAIPKLLKWLLLYRDSQDSNTPSVDFGSNFGQKDLKITEIIDIEETAWAPRYGLKGMIDASVRVKLNSSNEGASDKIMPLEFKTGKGTSGQTAMEHSAQVILYAILMSERYLQEIDSGLLFYLHTDDTKGIMVRRPDLVGLIMRRNELATEVLKASKMQILPPMLQNPSICKSCRHLNVCAIYHKAEGGSTEGSGLGDLFHSCVVHLTTSHYDFLQKWDRLIDLEAKETMVAKKKMWRSSTFGGEKKGNNRLSNMILDSSSEYFPKISSKDGRFIYRFVHQESHKLQLKTQNGNLIGSEQLSISNLDCSLRTGDYVVLSTESGRFAIANGRIVDISNFHVLVSFSRRLRLPGIKPPLEIEDLIKEIWRLDKDELASSYAIMRSNIVQLLMDGSQSSHLRKLIVDLEAPRFDSGGIFSQDPAVTYIQSEKSLNNDQRRAVLKILAAKDYALILGMPGTGKTSTLVHAVKALLMKGYSILLTSYTNSALDNLLVKLKAQGIDFVRIGRDEAIHEDIQDHWFSAMKTTYTLEDIKQRMNQVKVVGLTCLGINHPLLANKKFDICIMDEAGQTTLPVSLGPLMFASMFVLVGDHYQLPPLVQSTEAKENGMGQSLFCRLSEAHPQAISSLQCQYRMSAGIMELSNALIYGNRLRCGSSGVATAKLQISSSKPIVSWLKKVLDPERSTVFIDTDMLPASEVKEHKAITNPTEAGIIMEIVEALGNGGIIGDAIGIITPYNSQASLIRHVVGTNIEIHTIDKYQGRDKECILVSFVRSCENPRVGHSTILGDWQRINVAITRAKKKLIMVGSRRTLSKVPLLKLLIEKVDEQIGIVNISKQEICPLGNFRKCSQPR